MPIGITIESDQLVLTKGRDFKWAFENLDDNEPPQPIDYPAGELFFEFPELLTVGVPKKWSFVIDGSMASIKVESTEVDTIPVRGTKWQLAFLEDGEESGGDPIDLGTVTVQGV